MVLPDPYSYLEIGERYYEYALPWDQVAPLSYKPWTGTHWNLAELQANSARRIAAHPGFALVEKNIERVRKQREATRQPLQLAAFIEQERQAQLEAEKFMRRRRSGRTGISSAAKRKTKSTPPGKRNGWINSRPISIWRKRSMCFWISLMPTAKRWRLNLLGVARGREDCFYQCRFANFTRAWLPRPFMKDKRTCFYRSHRKLILRWAGFRIYYGYGLTADGANVKTAVSLTGRKKQSRIEPSKDHFAGGD